MAPTVQTPLTKMLGIKYPIMLAGMAKVSNAELAAAVSLAGGCGVIGGVSKTPKQLRADIKELKHCLGGRDVPFGVDLLLPKVGGGARKTNKDYTKGALPEIVDILCEEKPTIFVSAVGVAPKWVVEKLHGAGIICANMVGSPKHVRAALANGVDMIIAQGHEGGGHTGDITTTVLIPQVADLCRGKKNFFGQDVVVVAAGGIYDGRGLAAALTFGAAGVWVGTAFITAQESGATPMHQKMVIEHNSWDTIRTSAMTGRPCRMIKTDYINEWENGSRRAEREALEAQGIVAYAHDVHETRKRGEHFDVARTFPQFAGQAIGGITQVRPAAAIIEDMMTGACTVLTEKAKLVTYQASL